MNDTIKRSISVPIRQGLSWNEQWGQDDGGLILCWEVGRKKGEQDKELATRALNNELPVLGWKGGVERTIQKKSKYGSLNYLAQWQGLRGEDLNINTSQEVEMVCSKTKMTVIYTNNKQKYKNA